MSFEKIGDLFVIRLSKSLVIGCLEKNLDKFDSIYQFGMKDVKSGMFELNSYLMK